MPCVETEFILSLVMCMYLSAIAVVVYSFAVAHAVEVVAMQLPHVAVVDVVAAMLVIDWVLARRLAC